MSQLIGKLDIFENSLWTIVCWDSLELHEQEFSSKKTEQGKDRFIARKIDTLTIYLRTIFHRFLSGENGARKINIYINGKKIKEFDPFCRNERNTLIDPFYNNEGQFNFGNSDIPSIYVTRYILPTKEGDLSFSNSKNWKEASGYLNWNDAQGYYVYRNNRLIEFGGWFGTKGKDEHDKLARVSIDLSDKHDRYFKLDLKKSSIQFGEEFNTYLKDTINKDYITRARSRYKKAEKNVPIVNNKLRTNKSSISDLSAQLIKSNEINISEKSGIKGKSILVTNPNGTFTEKELLYRELDPNLTIITKDFGNDEIFWKMVPGPGKYFQILINESHPFYEKIYLKSFDNKVATSSVDALLYTLAFIELRFKTESNRMLFLEINEVVSDVLKKIISKNLF